jgi:NitT/TauT family transport system substrate-binding protein
MRGLSRRGLLAAAAAAAVPSAARATMEPFTIAVPGGADITSIEVLNAKAGGHFAAQGLDATVAFTGTGVGGMQQLVAGRCQVFRGAAIEVIKAVARQNVPVLSIGCVEHRVTLVLLSSPDRPIRDVSMLRGKRIGVYALGSTFDNFLDLMLHAAGLPADAVTREGVGGGPAVFETVRMGRLDGVIQPYEVVWPLLHPPQGAAGEIPVVLPVSAVVKLPGRGYLTTSTIVAQLPDLALAFTRAMAASVQEIIATPDAALYARCAAAFDFPPTRTAAQSVGIMQWMAATWMAEGRAELLRNPEAGWRAGVAEMAAAGIASVKPGTELYTNRFVDQVLSR